MRKPKLHVYQTVPQLILNHQSAPIAFNGKLIDTLGVFDTTAGKNTRFYPTVPGRYRGFAAVAYDVLAVGDRSCIFVKNGALSDEAPAGAQPAGNTTDTAGIATCQGVLPMNGTSDYVELWANQHSDRNLATFYSPGTWLTYMIFEWFAP